MRAYEAELVVDLGNPLLNRVFNGFVKVGAVGAIHAAGQEATGFCYYNTEQIDKKRFQQCAQRIANEALQWGFVGGVYSGLTCGIHEARGGNDWKTALLGGALTGAALSLTEKNSGTEHVLRSAITGSTVAVAAQVLRRII